MTSFRFQNRKLPFVSSSKIARPIWVLTKEEVAGGALPEAASKWIEDIGFKGAKGEFSSLPSKDGSLAGAVFGLGDGQDTFCCGKLSKLLPEGDWEIKSQSIDVADIAFAFGLGSYRFKNYLKPEEKTPRLLSKGIDNFSDVERKIYGSFLAKDLINIPTNDMGPADLEKVFKDIGKTYKAKVKVIQGDDLLKQNFPLIHAVGRASESAPRLLEMKWGKKDAPKLALVGKGVCFDTGGLNIKPTSAMGLMKKDMGGAANILALALMIMDADLPVNLHVLIPAVENSISDNAFRPGDILTSRSGLTIQIDNTDAEGRLVLADALTFACEHDPELVIDMATLTGAARVALGPDLPPYYTDDEILSGEISSAALDQNDLVWRMPLYKGYEGDVKTRISDLTNAPSGGFAGSITAALFLKRFVTEETPWVHLDIYGWNPKERAHSPVGGEAQAIRTLFTVLEKRYG